VTILEHSEFDSEFDRARDRHDFERDRHDFELDHPVLEPIDPVYPPSHAGLAIAIVVLLALGGGLGYYVYRTYVAPVSTGAAETPTAPAQPIAQQPQAPAVAAADVVLPPLPQTDPVVRELLGALSSHPTILAWLATKGLIANFAVVTLNISEGRGPTTHLQALAPRAPFRTRGSGSALYVDPRSYDRYNRYAEAVTALDATGAARLYATLKPRILDAYRELGYPDGDFDRVLERAIGQLLNVPVVNGNVALRRESVSYTYADPALESLSPAQRQFLRMGPQNVQAVQAKLLEIATLLNLHPQKGT
jgi:hypothetical protein